MDVAIDVAQMDEVQITTHVDQLVSKYNNWRYNTRSRKLDSMNEATLPDQALICPTSNQNSKQNSKQKPSAQTVTKEAWAEKTHPLRAKLCELGLNNRGKKAELCQRLIDFRLNKINKPIDASANPWLNDDHIAFCQTENEKGDDQQHHSHNETCLSIESQNQNDGNHDGIQNPHQGCNDLNATDHFQLTMILLDAVEKLTGIMLEHHSNPTKTMKSPQPCTNSLPASSSPKQNNYQWETVSGNKRSHHKPTNAPTECFNYYDVLQEVPTEHRSVVEEANTIQASSWELSPHTKPKKHQQRPQVVINKSKPRTRKTIPGNNSFSGAVQHGQKVAIFSDSICNRMGKQQLRQKLNCNVNKKSFPGATTDELYDHYMLPTLKKNTPDTAIIHIGVNDILEKGTPDGGMTSNAIEEVSQDIIRCGEVCRSYGVNNICISSVLPFKGRRSQLTVNQINSNLAKLCEERCFDFLLNDNIFYDKSKSDNVLFYSDGLHLNDLGRDVLIDNFSNYVH